MKTHEALPALLFLTFLPGAVSAQALTSLELSPSTTAGGQASQGMVSISAPAPAGGTLVILSSGNAAVAATPASTLVPAGATSSAFTVTTAPAAGTTAVTISAKLGAVTKTATLTVEPTPPVTLVLGAFTLTGATYTSSDWDPGASAWTGAAGAGMVTLTADGEVHPIAVHFDDLTIAPIVQGTGSVTGGSVSYTPPGSPPQPEVLALAGFELLLDGLTIGAAGATATGRLEFPASLTDAAGGECRPGVVDLGTFPITPDCRFYVWLPASAYGPWVLGHHGIRFTWLNSEIDFSPAQSPVTTPALPAAFRGVVLRLGSTVEGQAPVISNTGYLQAKYSFTDAVVTGAGMKARLELAQPFTFSAIEPWGYRIEIPAGHLDVADSVVTGGVFTGGATGKIHLPERAVKGAVVTLPVSASYGSLVVQPDLDLHGDVSVSVRVGWGEFRDPAVPQFFYDFGPVGAGHFYLSATPRPAFWPLDGNGAFKDISLANPPVDLEAQGIQGATFRLTHSDGQLRIRTPDTPWADMIPLHTISPDSWLHVGSRGVHGEIRSRAPSVATPPALQELELGPTHLPSYAPGDGAGEPFDFTLGPWLFQFVESAVHRSSLNGSVSLAGPTNADLRCETMRFTSSAHNTGGMIEFADTLPEDDPDGIPDPVELDYWAVDIAPKQTDSPLGVLGVKTGQIFLTGAGIQEPRHFAKPFNLLWGELLADGQLGRMLFDHNSTGQKFDGFAFTPEIVAFSEYDPDDAGGANAYLHVAGTAHFDFFGDSYLDLRDGRHPNGGLPHFGRKITLEDGGEHGALPTEYHLARDWDGGFGAVDFTIRYDEADQDGFISNPQADGSNHIQIESITEPVAASLELSSKRACISIYEEAKRDVSFPMVPSFGSIHRISGCGCIEEGVLERLVFSSELYLGSTGGIIQTGEYVSVEKIITPATSELFVNGTMLLDIAAGSGDVQVIGQLHFLVDRENDFVEGDVKGKIDASSFLGIVQVGALSAEGQLSWHFGSFDNGGYQLLQGKVAVAVVAPAGAAGVGVEGGFLVGVNAPKEKAWVIIGTDPRFDVNLELLPDRLSGVFGYAKVSSSINAYVVSGGFDAYMGLGGFLAEEGPVPAVFGHMSANLWGEFLGGLLSAAVWLDAQLYLAFPAPPKFQGSAGLEVCAVWVICGTEEVTMTADGNGFTVSK